MIAYILGFIFVLFILILIWNAKSKEKNKANGEAKNKPNNEGDRKDERNDKQSIEGDLWTNSNKKNKYLSWNDRGLMIMKYKENLNRMQNMKITFDNGMVRLSNGKCMEAGKLEGDRVSYQTCNDSNLQLWKYEQMNWINKENNLCMETIGNSDEIRMWKCDSELISQKWLI